jgi:hypothetical protein
MHETSEIEVLATKIPLVALQLSGVHVHADLTAIPY